MGGRRGKPVALVRCRSQSTIAIRKCWVTSCRIASQAMDQAVPQAVVARWAEPQAAKYGNVKLEFRPR
eukprot:7838528-Prorocentrum_lima.AAC.1